MAQVKKPENADWLTQAFERVRQHLGPALETRYSVYEVTPEWTDSGYWGEQHHPAKRVRVFSGSLHDISNWEDTHEPNKGNRFEVVEETLHEIKHRRWIEGKRIK